MANTVKITNVSNTDFDKKILAFRKFVESLKGLNRSVYNLMCTENPNMFAGTLSWSYQDNTATYFTTLRFSFCFYNSTFESSCLRASNTTIGSQTLFSYVCDSSVSFERFNSVLQSILKTVKQSSSVNLTTRNKKI